MVRTSFFVASFAARSAVQRAGWPLLLAVLLLLGSAGALGVSWWAQREMRAMSLQILAAQTKRATVQQQTGTSPTEASLPYPGETLYLDDLAGIFKSANAAGVNLGVVDYKTERSDKLPLTLYTLEIKLKDDYPKVKAFLSQTLTQLSHASLQELRMERPDAASAQGLMLVRLMLVYQNTLTGPSNGASAPAPLMAVASAALSAAAGAP